MGDGGIIKNPQMTGQSDKPELYIPLKRGRRSLAVLELARRWFFDRRMPADPNPFPKFHLFRRVRRTP